jgi:hypothetical protein
VGGGAKEPKGHREKGGAVQLISPPGKKSWESQWLQPKKGPNDLRGKKEKAQQEAQKQIQKKYQKL